MNRLHTGPIDDDAVRTLFGNVRCPLLVDCFCAKWCDTINGRANAETSARPKCVDPSIQGLLVALHVTTEMIVTTKNCRTNDRHN